MIVCAICGDVEGPWAYEDGIGFICEDCIENGNLDAEREANRRLDQDVE